MTFSINVPSLNYTFNNNVGLRVHKSGRYLIDQSNKPFFIVGDSGQTMIARLSLANIASYLDTRKSQGFNAVMIELSSHLTAFAAGCPASFLGDQPFTTKVGGGAYVGTSGTADFTTPNTAYWNYVDSALSLIEARGMIALIYPLAWGFGLDGSQGWWPDMMLSANTRAVHTGLGTFIGNRYKNKTNIMWLHGSDDAGNTTGSPESGIARAHALMTGMIAAGATQLRAGDWNKPSESTDAPSDGVKFSDYISVQGTYSYGGQWPATESLPGSLQTYLEARRGYSFVPTLSTQGQTGNVIPALPCFLKETTYKSSPNHPGTDPDVRRATWWAVLSGDTTGFFYGYDNSVAGHGVDVFATNWATDVLDSSALDVQRMSSFMQSLSWWKLVPSELAGMRLLITTSNGVQTVGASYIAAAQARDGSFMLCFVPNNGSGAQSFSVDFRSMKASSRARWWDPTTGTFTDASAGAYSLANTLSAQSFTTPGNNNSGTTNDWVLILDVQ